MSDGTPETRHYFVDEAGDPVLFGRRGEVRLGSQGCSRYFVIGMADIENESTLVEELEALRRSLLADPYFRNVPSMQPGGRKTALLFHAKDDLPEVRREVFRILQRHVIRFSAVVRDKRQVLAYVRSRNETDSTYRYRQDELYDYMLRRLFKQRLHTHDSYSICVARRGSSDRKQAITHALTTAREDFALQHGINHTAVLDVVSSSPLRHRALQAVDYFLWALQRTYERREDRFLQLLWPQCSLIVDMDDKREKGYGVYYTKEKPLSAAALKAAEGYGSESPR